MTYLNRMATDNLAKQIGASYIYGIDPESDQIFQQFAAQGQSYFNASGDGDAYVGGAPSPSDDPYITSVGGTTLTTAGPGGAWASETVWNRGNRARQQRRNQHHLSHSQLASEASTCRPTTDNHHAKYSDVALTAKIIFT